MKGGILRPATADDAPTIFHWRNDPWIVSLSSSQKPVEWDEHIAWFDEALDRSRHLTSIVLEGSSEAGTVRVDRQGDRTAFVTIYLMQGFVGKGLGTMALRLACSQAFEQWPEVDSIIGNIRLDNSASVRAFERAGFAPVRSEVDGHVAMELRRPPTRAEFTTDDERTVDYFSKLVSRYGSDVRATDWGSAESQALRFSVLASIGDLNGRRVLDVGCGQGGLLEFFLQRGTDVDYTGVDLVPAMIEACRAHYPGRAFDVRNLLLDPLPDQSFDYVFASGIFYLRQVRPMDFVRKMIECLWKTAAMGVAFNSLSAWSSAREAGEFYADPVEVLDYCRTLTPRLALRHDYHHRDFTVHLLREPSGNQ